MCEAWVVARNGLEAQGSGCVPESLEVKLSSPHLGFGEWSLKEDQAILSGAVLVTPGASLLDSVIPLRPDGEDLFEVLVGALEKLTALEEIKALAHKALRGFGDCWKPGHPAVLSIWAEIVSRLVRRRFTRWRVELPCSMGRRRFFDEHDLPWCHGPLVVSNRT